MKKLIIYLFLLSLLIVPAESQVKIFYYTPPKDVPKNIVIINASGMGVSQLSAAMIENGGNLNLEKFPVVGLVKPWAKGDVISDPASNATAIATGTKVAPGKMGVDEQGKVLKNLFELAKEKKMATAMIVTGSVLGSTPVSFALHDTSGRSEDIPISYLRSDIDILIGGGSKYFDQRADGRNILQDFYNKGYDIEKKARRVGKLKQLRTIALVGEEDIYGASKRKDYLEDATINTMNLLSTHGLGYMLLVDVSRIADAAAYNKKDYFMEEMMDLDATIGLIHQYFSRDPNTLVIVMGNHETGGLAVTGGSLENKKAELEWANKKATASLVPLFAMGPGSEQFAGVYDNTAIYEKIVKFLSLRNYK